MWRRSEDEPVITANEIRESVQAPARRYVTEEEARAYWASGRSKHEAKQLLESHRDEQDGGGWLYYLPE